MPNDNNALPIEVKEFAPGDLMVPAAIVFDRDPGDWKKRHILLTALDKTPERWSTNGGKGATPAAARRYTVPVYRYVDQRTATPMPDADTELLVSAAARRCQQYATAHGIVAGGITILKCSHDSTWWVGAFITEGK